MLKRLLQNTLISGIAYGVSGVLGLISVGIVVRAYGIAAFGLLALVRSFLPSGLLALIDFGMSENATQAVARARAGAGWITAGEYITMLSCGALGIGAAAGAALWLASPELAELFKVAADQQAAFIRILSATAGALPLVFLGIVIEGIIKGFEEYGQLRWVEMATASLYVACVFGLAKAGVGYESIAYAFLVTLVVKYLLLAVVSAQLAAGSPLRLRRWSRSNQQALLHQCGIMFANRVGGVMQMQVPTLLIGAMIGAGGVGVYDILTRLPRFLKSALALVSSALLPVSTRILESRDTARMVRLGRSGFVLPAAVSIPILTSIGLFSEEVLRLWVGPSLSVYWPWLAAMLLAPGVAVLLGPGQTALLVRLTFVGEMNRLLLLQTAVQYAISLGFMRWFQERAFILGQVAAILAFAPLIAHRLLKEWNLSPWLFWSTIAKHGAIVFVLTIPVLILKVTSPPLGQYGVLAGIGLCCIAAWILAYALFVTREDHYAFASLLRAAFR